MIKFARNRKVDEWVLIGPVADLVEGQEVEVTTAKGKVRKKTVGQVGPPFTAKFGEHEGEQVCFAQIAMTDQDRARRDADLPF